MRDQRLELSPNESKRQTLYDRIEALEYLTVVSPDTPTFSCLNSSSNVDICIANPNLLRSEKYRDIPHR